MKFSLSGLLAMLSVAAFSTEARAQEWTRFRGPNGSGISHATTMPANLTAADINWKVELPGVGHSSPVLWGEKIFVTSAGENEGGLNVLCLEAADGKVRWKKEFPLTPF